MLIYLLPVVQCCWGCAPAQLQDADLLSAALLLLASGCCICQLYNLKCLLWTQLLTKSCLLLLLLLVVLLLDVVNDKEDVVVFPRFVGNIDL